MNAIIYRTRILLINIGKILPFVICSIVLVSYFESVVSMYNEDYILYDSYAILRKPVSFFIGQYFEYNLQMLVVLCIISIAIETCIFNKLACGYLGINLLEKSYFDFELEPTFIYIICIINIAICSFFCYKGIKILLSSRKQ
jgi:hypothetical protein